MKENKDTKFIIIFDGICNMCIWSARFIISRDNNNFFLLTSNQSKLGIELIKKYKIDLKKNDSIFLLVNNKVLMRSSAFFFIISHIKTSWKILLIFYPLPRFLTDFFYNIIAKYRYIFFGKRKKCILPNELTKTKFIK
tara:strand:+ start:1020 stop:1433 length:414 start_codon:yes stop_codon:yes gene_type:complete